MKREKRFGLLGLCLVLGILFAFSGAASGAFIYETTDFITGVEGVTYDFYAAEDAPFTYVATLSDLSFGLLGFDYISLSISTATETLGFIEEPGSFQFMVVPGAHYFANVFGVGTGEYETGLFGLQISQVPIPSTLLLLGGGLIGIFSLKRRRS